MKRKNFSSGLLITILYFVSFAVLAEGTNEIMPSAANPTKMHLSKYHFLNDESYNDFALYRALPNERLQFTVKDATEIVYFGFQPKPAEATADFKFRIKNEAGVVVFPTDGTEVRVPGSGIGWINGLAQAQYGPNTINPLGYTPFVFNPSAGGDYYLEFNFNGPDPPPAPNQPGTTKTLECFDITVATSGNVAIPGRVWSKAWQFTTDGTNNTSKAMMFPYTDDGITTRIDLNGISPYRFAVSCNKTGVAASGNIAEDRKSVTGLHTYPQYRVFLNIPDHSIPYFAEGELGQLISASASEINCDGSVKFEIMVNKDGYVNVTLGFSGGFITRLLPPADVLASPAVNVISWDGKDGANNPVPNGTTISVSVQYVNGLTNLPMYDAEYMNGTGYPTWNGLIVDLVSPAGNKPSLFWDDTKITGCIPPAGSNYAGCTAPTGCHPWNYCIGNANTINTWWYALSNSTINITPFNSHRTPGPLGVITGETEICQGAGNKVFSVVAEANSESYEWTFPAGVTAVSTPPYSNSITLDFTTATTSGNIQVRGVNSSGCAAGPWSTIPIVIHPIPTVTTPDQTVCSGLAYNIPLTSLNDPAVSYSWTVAPGDCSPEIVTCPTGTSTANPITGNVSVSGLLPGTVSFHVTPNISICPGPAKIVTLTVSPLPDATTSPGPNSNLCSSQTTNINLSSTFPTTTFSWNAPVCSNILTVPPGGVGSSIGNPLTLVSNAIPGSADYSIIPNNNGCIGNTVHHIVTVNTLPVPLINGSLNFSVCKGSQEVYTTEPGMSGYVWTISAGGTINSGQGTNTLAVTWNTVGSQQLTVNYINGNNCTSASPSVQNITVKPIPNVKTSPVSTFSICSGLNAQVSLSSDVPGTEASTTFSWTASGNGATLTPNPSTIPPTAGNINQAFTNTGNVLEPVVFHILPTSAGCSQALPTDFTVNINPVAAVSTLVQSIPSSQQSVCSGVAILLISLQTNVTGLTVNYNWTAACDVGITACPPVSGTGNPIPSYTPGNATVSQKNIVYSITASVNATSGTCSGTPSPYTVHVNPLPITTFSGATTVCQDYPTKYLYPSVTGPACTYLWSISPASYGIIDNATASTASITWKTSGNPDLQLSGITTEGCTSSSSQSILVNAKPVVVLSACFDLVTTTNAKPFILKGGTPLGSGGKYYIDGTLVPSSILDPATLGVTTHSVSFTYTDANACLATAAQTLTVKASNAGYQCYNNIFTDPRNVDPATNKYPTTTVTANGRTTCWMLKNLNCGVNISSVRPQTDNCLVERYCPANDNTCNTYGSLFQWDEVMQYGSTPSWSKGVCPPGWHVPTILEWQDLIDASQGNGIAGGALKDLVSASGFKGLLNGMLYFNDIWAFTASDNLKASMFWTSTMAGSKPVTRGINFINPSVSYYESPKANAYPVRCVKD